MGWERRKKILFRIKIFKRVKIRKIEDKKVEYFYNRWKEFYGKEEAQRIVDILNSPQKRTIATSILKKTDSEIIGSLREKGFELKPTDIRNAYFIEYEPFATASTLEYLSGYFTIQAVTSLIPPNSFDYDESLKEKRVIDAAASPGIKTIQMAIKMGNSGMIMAIEKSTKRLPQLLANISRMGIKNTIVINKDARRIESIKTDFDYGIIDAPCTGTGIRWKKEKRTKEKSRVDVERLSKLQKEMLESVWKKIKNGGSIIYSVCSLEPEEGEKQIDRFIKNHYNEIQLETIPIAIGQSGDKINTKIENIDEIAKTRRILPSETTDGFFVAKIRKEIR